jgi:predicted ArsR family transcriptional regulator
LHLIKIFFDLLPGMQRTAWNRRLLASTRGRVLALLRDEHRTVNELADALGLTDNAVRAQLLSLERDGLVQQQGTRRGRRKPHVTYSLSSEAEHVFPKAYGLLLDYFVGIVSKRLTPQALRTSMRELGRKLASAYLDRTKRANRNERIKVALDLLKELGGSSRLDKHAGKEFIYGPQGCPLAAVTANHPEACLIVESLLSEIIGVTTKKCCEYGQTPRCCFELGR